MHNDCRARWNDNLIGSDCVETILVNHITITHYGVGRLRQLHRFLNIVSIENHNDIVQLL